MVIDPLRRLATLFGAHPPKVVVGEGGFEIVERGTTTRIALADLTEVGILTTADGPMRDDVFWVLQTDKAKHVVAWSTQGSDALLEALQTLPGFDHGAVVLASGSTEVAAFLAWRG